MENQERCGEEVERWMMGDRRLGQRSEDRRLMLPSSLSQDPVRRKLAAIIEREVLPRLMLAHRQTGHETSVLPFDGSGDDPDGFVRLLIAGDGMAARLHVESLLASGMSREVLFLDIISGAARRLGELWEADACDFLDVTAGVMRLQSIVNELSGGRPGMRATSGGRRVLLTAAPGEMHTFGLSLVAGFFESAGWEVSQMPEAEVADAVATQSFGVVGYSLGREAGLEALAAAIRTVRRVSRNPSIAVMVGGKSFLDRPELVSIVGADMTASDGVTAVLLAQSFLDMRASAC